MGCSERVQSCSQPRAPRQLERFLCILQQLCAKNSTHMQSVSVARRGGIKLDNTIILGHGHSMYAQQDECTPKKDIQEEFSRDN